MIHAHQTGGAEKSTLRKYPFVLIGFLLVIGYFLLTEHRAHIIPFLPFVLLAACPLMHVFMHGGHGGHGGHGERTRPNDPTQQGDT